MVRHRQAIQREHAEYGRDSGEQNRHFEGDDDESGPGMRRLAADVKRIVDGGHPILHQVSGEAADDAADQDDQRDFVVMETDFFGHAFDRKGAVGIDLLISGFVSLARRIDQRLCRIELRHHAVDGIALHGFSFTSASGRRVRISKIEIAGSTRRNRNISIRNMPIVPM